MKTLTYERLFFLGTSYSKDGHERIVISETVEDADNEEKIKDLFKKVLCLHEQFDKYRDLVAQYRRLAEEIACHIRELAQVEDYISQLKTENLDDVLDDGRRERKKEHLAEQEKRREDIKSTILNQTTAKETAVVDLLRCKEALGLI